MTKIDSSGWRRSAAEFPSCHSSRTFAELTENEGDSERLGGRGVELFCGVSRSSMEGVRGGPGCLEETEDTEQFMTSSTTVRF